MRRSLRRVAGPFPLAVSDAAFDPETLARLDRLFATPLAWARHDAHFYRCFIAEVDDALPGAQRAALREAVAAALEVELAGPVRITAQRMEPGDGSDRHTDAPRAGYEAARLIVQLRTSRGGRFRAFDGDRPWLVRPAVRNQAVAMALGPSSHHDVTRCGSVRRTLVVHFWHAANPPPARAWVERRIGSMTFAALPRALDAAVDAADATMDPVVTDRAARVAWVLHARGRTGTDLEGAFTRTLRGAPVADDDEALARFVTTLYLDGFVAEAWDGLPEGARRAWLGELHG